MEKPAVLALENGVVFRGISCGYDGDCGGEVVFNTAMTGYQEILSDPSYAEQIICFTYPHIGNTGINQVDNEAQTIRARGVIFREIPTTPSNWRSEQSLSDYLQQQQVPAIAEIDTRALTHCLRDQGAMRGVILTGDINDDDAIAKARAVTSIVGANLANAVTCQQQFVWQQGTWQWAKPSHVSQARHHVVAYDFGVKQTILRLLADRDCALTIVPAHTKAQDVLALKPDGIFLSNGPGDPAACTAIIEEVKILLDRHIPLFGICLGHQLLALAAGAKTVKMKFGHHGANHPVQDLRTKRVMITSQNHGFAVDEASLPDNIIVTHHSLFDGSLQGMRFIDKPIFSFQGHPEASPGPHDLLPIFDEFMSMLTSNEVNHA